MTPTEVIVADDHPVLRHGLQALLSNEPDIAIVAEATTGEEAAGLCVDRQPDVLLLDLSMPGQSARDTVSQVRERAPETGIIVLTAHRDPATARDLLGLGARGYVLKDDAPEAVGEAIRAVLSGRRWCSAGIVWSPHDEAEPAGTPRLTDREQELMELLVQGHDVNGIAETLVLSGQTVRNYLHTLYRKLGVTSRAQAVIWAYQHGFARR
jgi:DNA-binding NarL/FixJ family response regulator